MSDEKQPSNTPIHDPVIGAEVSGYRVTNRLGSGGMGIVYEGEQPVIGKRVAIKVLRHEVADNPDVVQRLVAEARAVNQVGHRGIIDVFGFGQLPDGRQCIVMEYLDGESLESIVRSYQKAQQRLSLHDVFTILDEILSALAAAHVAGVVHRDLKPSNIFLCRQRDGTRYVKLLDFGIAKLGVLGGSTPATRASLMVGTPAYMAPEQASGGLVGPAMDLYALGVVAFELATGRQPFVSDSVMGMLMAHASTPPPSMVSIVPTIPPAFDQLVARLLAKSPDARPPSADVVKEELLRIRATLPVTSAQGVSLLVTPKSRTGEHPVAPALSVDEHAVAMAATSLSGKQPPLPQPPHEANEVALAATSLSGKQQPLPKQVEPPVAEPSEVAGMTTSQLTPLVKSRSPIVAMVVVGVLLLGGAAGWLFVSPREPAEVSAAEKPPLAVAPKTNTPEVVAPAPQPPPATNGASPEPTTPAAEGPAKEAAPEPVVHPSVVAAPIGEPKPASPAPAPVAKKAAAHASPAVKVAAVDKTLSRYQKAVAKIGANLDRAEKSGETVTLYRKALEKVRAKLDRWPLSPQDEENVELTLSRLEEETNSL